MPRVIVTSGGRQGSSLGCLGSLLAAVLLILLVAALTVGALVIVAVVGAILAVGVVAIAVDRILLALSPKRRARRGQVHSAGVIDTTAWVEPPARRDGASDSDPKELPGADADGLPHDGPGSPGPRA